MIPVSIPMLVALLTATTLGGVIGAEWMAKQAILTRLRTMLGGLPQQPLSHDIVQFLGKLGAHLPGAADESLQTALARAGYFQPAAKHLFVVLRLAATIAVFVGIWLEASVSSATTLLLAMFLAFFTSRLFVILLKLKAESRERALRRELPPLVDFLLMVLNSGVSIDQCLRYVTGTLERTAPLINIVLKRYITDVDSGMAYEAAFERLGQRLGINEGYDLVNLIKQSLLHGGEIMASLESFSVELADKRLAKAREQIGRKSVFLTVAMLAFFMPVLLITLGGPAVSRITQTLKVVKHDIHNRERTR
jgi:tight adherence protein C